MEDSKIGFERRFEVRRLRGLHTLSSSLERHHGFGEALQPPQGLGGPDLGDRTQPLIAASFGKRCRSRVLGEGSFPRSHVVPSHLPGTGRKRLEGRNP
ncbi:MAG TPA: hypothetical protein VN851_25495 [Thermoanaerobaculia bacterium]|nr:hypothetical protein [Thermoanaerobaculia bacterium]